MINTITPLWATTDTSGDSRLPVCETLHERVRIQVLRSRLDDRGAQGRQAIVDVLTRETEFRQAVQREYFRSKEPVPIPLHRRLLAERERRPARSGRVATTGAGGRVTWRWYGKVGVERILGNAFTPRQGAPRRAASRTRLHRFRLNVGGGDGVADGASGIGGFMPCVNVAISGSSDGSGVDGATP